MAAARHAESAPPRLHLRLGRDRRLRGRGQTAQTIPSPRDRYREWSEPAPAPACCSTRQHDTPPPSSSTRQVRRRRPRRVAAAQKNACRVTVRAVSDRAHACCGDPPAASRRRPRTVPPAEWSSARVARERSWQSSGGVRNGPNHSSHRRQLRHHSTFRRRPFINLKDWLKGSTKKY